MSYNLTDTSSAIDYLQSVQNEAGQTPMIAFLIAVAILTLTELMRRGYSFENSTISTGFTTSLIGFIFFTLGIVNAQYIFAPLSLVFIGILIKSWS